MRQIVELGRNIGQVRAAGTVPLGIAALRHANSQFYIVFQPRFALDKKYTVFGRVIDGMQYVDAPGNVTGAPRLGAGAGASGT
jgi:cyclophilin family peptidyl-prolyl cis-trans isomerase